LGFQAFHEKSFLGIWYQVTAQFVFVCQSLHDDLYSPCIGKETIVVNLWHGLPLKKIMYDVFGNRISKRNSLGKLFDLLMPYYRSRNDILLATSEETQDTLSNAFRVPKERTLITGFPRNDIFLKGAPSSDSVGSKYKCIYMPTFRGGKGTECDLFFQYGFNASEIEEELARNNIELVLRMHPVNKPPQKVIEAIRRSSSISIDDSVDIFDSIASYDCMITDYSGGYFDFLLTGKPVLFAPFDLENYKQKERDLYYDYEEVTLSPYAFTWPEMIDNIISAKQGCLGPEYERTYKLLSERFHQPLHPGVSRFSEALYQKLISSSDYS
jgi:CDP-glycerol glycerophosphotransferase